MSAYYRPLPRSGPLRPGGALPLAGGSFWFADIALEQRGRAPEIVPAREAPHAVLERLTAARAPIAGCDMRRTRIMGILNVTPDSFSDGGRYQDRDAALVQARRMHSDGADIIDVGGESTRPGARTVSVSDEIDRVAAPIRDVAAQLDVPISIDTRKAEVARAALHAGAAIVNDVSGFTFDPALAPLCAERGVPVCVMHAQGDPETMQDAPRYDDVRLDVYDFLSERVDALVAQGIARERIIVDPGIGFGKTLEHNLALLRDIALFHALGCPILLGASRKKFIGTISGAEAADARMPGSVAIALHAATQGVQIVRVHDVLETRQALASWRAVNTGEG
ncbi:dihydropteroate synthase [Marivita sp. GX14005]|uniref:dihydropteroate synthase n=1 Tax=Marivita sp. GX14005 TaxID=2942276 RepID=UPI0020191794|nr:dihydropteroate synthase [Marivita sp. GX14005]MCL3882414.1 dihydropteroate synthase [Marivita sp. GX14005]